MLGPIAFCDVVGYEESAETEEDIKTSKKNVMEADRAVRQHKVIGVLYCLLWSVLCMHAHLQIDVVKALDVITRSKAEITVITPYKAQERCIIKRFNGMNKNWKVKTVDASQGEAAS